MAVAEIYREYRPILPLVAATAALAWLVGWTIYARWFHPLAKVPGPFLASVTELYRFYYNFVRNGSYYLKFEDFRAKYGKWCPFPPRLATGEFSPAAPKAR